MTELQVRSGRATLTGISAGHGETVIFLHAGVADHRMWAEVIPRLAGEYHVVAYDRRGFGSAQATPEAYSHVDDLLAVLDTAGIDRATLVGCSQGARIAVDFALAHPARVTALVLIAPAVGGAPGPSTFPPPVEALLEELDAAETAGDLTRLNELEARVWLDGVLGPAERVRGARRELFLDMNGAALRAGPLGDEVTAGPAWPRLPEIQAPTLLICGSLDFPHVAQRSLSMAEQLPRAHFREMEGTAHLPSFEEPEAFTARLMDFLTSLDTA